MLKLQIKIDKDGLTLHVHCTLQINTPARVAHGASLKCSLHWPERGFAAPASERYCEIDRSFQLSIITAPAIKSPIVAYNPQISKLELMRNTKCEKDLRTGNEAERC